MTMDLKELSREDCFVTTTRFSVELCNKNLGYLFVFGDNEQRIGKGGQAIIRGCPNTIGLRTKRSIAEFWTDRDYHRNCKLIDEDIHSILSALYLGYRIVFASSGYGNGLAELPTRAPETYLYLKNKLDDYFGFTF